jgi:hypothetical protein
LAGVKKVIDAIVVIVVIFGRGILATVRIVVCGGTRKPASVAINTIIVVIENAVVIGIKVFC